MPLTGCTLTGFDSNYVSDLGGAKRARTADLANTILPLKVPLKMISLMLLSRMINIDYLEQPQR
jgi:hypothetical protein